MEMENPANKPLESIENEPSPTPIKQESTRKRPLQLERQIAARHLVKDAYYSSLMKKSSLDPIKAYQNSFIKLGAAKAAESKQAARMPQRHTRIIGSAPGQRNLSRLFGTEMGSATPNDQPVITEEISQTLAAKIETLVPIRLALDIDGVKLNDVFTFNANDPVITPMYMAQLICQDYKLPRDKFTQPIASAIVSQVEAYLYHTPKVLQSDVGPEGRMDLDGEFTQYSTVTSGGILIPIKLDILLGSFHYLDTLDWDLSSRSNNPEDVANSIAQDVMVIHNINLDTARDLSTAIAYSIRQQLRAVGSSLLVGGMLENSDTELLLTPEASTDTEVQELLLPQLTEKSLLREKARRIYYEPFVEYFTELDETRYQQNLEKERKKRRKLGRTSKLPLVDPDVYRCARIALPAPPTGQAPVQKPADPHFGAQSRRPTRNATSNINYTEKNEYDEFVNDSLISKRPFRHL